MYTSAQIAEAFAKKLAQLKREEKHQAALKRDIIMKKEAAVDVTNRLSPAFARFSR